MGNTSKPKTTTAKRATKKTAAPENIVVPPTLKPTRATKPKRTTTRKPAAKKAKPATANASYTLDDVALRAYFIAERRQAHGLPGGPESDWLEAERQLRAECLA